MFGWLYRRSRTQMIAFALLLFLPIPKGAQSESLMLRSPDEPPALVGWSRVVLHQKFEQGEVGAAVSAPLAPGAGYATVSYSIGTPGQRKNLSAWIKYLAQTLPGTIGNSDGTYVVTLKLTNGSGGLNIILPIVSIQWTTQRAFLFFDKTINDISKTQWSGTLIDQMLIKGDNDKLTASIEISFHKDRSLDFSFLSQASNAGNAISLLSVLSLPAAASPIVSTVSGLVNDLYSNSTSEDVVDSDEIDITRPSVSIANIPIESSGEAVKLPVSITVSTVRSRLVGSALTDGKFDKGKISQTLFEVAQITVAPGKSVSLPELMVTAADDKSKKTRAFLDALENGAAYKGDDLNVRCGDFVTALDTYLSQPDARAVLWAFLQRYSQLIDRDKCLGTGTLRSELNAYGLTF